MMQMITKAIFQTFRKSLRKYFFKTFAGFINAVKFKLARPSLNSLTGKGSMFGGKIGYRKN